MPNDLEGLWTTTDQDEEDDGFTMARHQHTEQNLRIDRSIDVAEALLAIREMTESEAMKHLVEVRNLTPEEAFLAIKAAQVRPAIPQGHR